MNVLCPQKKPNFWYKPKEDDNVEVRVFEKRALNTYIIYNNIS